MSDKEEENVKTITLKFRVDIGLNVHSFNDSAYMEYSVFMYITDVPEDVQNNEKIIENIKSTVKRTFIKTLNTIKFLDVYSKDDDSDDVYKNTMIINTDKINSIEIFDITLIK